MTDDTPASTLPRPTGEGPGTARVREAVIVTDRDYLMIRRRSLIMELDALNRFLGIDRKPRRLNPGENVLE